MELTSLYFFAFVLFTCFIYYIIPKKAQWIILLIASLIFFVASSGILTLYMLAATLIIYLGALWINKRAEEFNIKKNELTKSERKATKQKLKKAQKCRLAFIVIAVLGILVALKYCNLGVEIANAVAGLFHTGFVFEKFSIILPLGISYYSLMAVSYVTDVYRGISKAEKNPFKVLLFVCYFPHIGEGPFDRYKDLSPQFYTGHKFDSYGFQNGVLLVLFGLFKKMVIADRLGIAVVGIFDHSDEYSGPYIMIATIMYTIQLYCDFSGCINIISGVSEMFGISVAKNFRQPFFAKSINEFWRRWHITLGLWLKEYVYYPIVLSGHFKRVDKFAKNHLKSQHLINVIPAAYALFFVWFSNGLWHGASIKFILYGLYYYFLMMLGELCKPVFEKLICSLRVKENSRWFNILRIVRTFVIVNIGMLLFRCETIVVFAQQFRSLFIWSDIGDSFMSILNGDLGVDKYDFILVIICVVILIVFDYCRERNIHFRKYVLKKNIFIRYAFYMFCIFVILIFGVYGAGFDSASFIYGGF